MGRSGSTLLFELLATHRDLGWLSHHSNRAPRLPWLHALSRLSDANLLIRKAIARSDESRSWVEKLRLGPAEAYETWASVCGEKIRFDWLLDARASDSERVAARRLVLDVLRWAGKRRFAAKFTGPPRIGYLASLFPDAIFVHVMRDGRAVARSLLNVDFWRDTPRLHEPAWRGGPPETHLDLWRSLGRSPLALAALQWRFAIETARRESAALGPGQYHELRYEDFLRSPETIVTRMLDACALAPDPRVLRFLHTRFALRDRTLDAHAAGSIEDATVLEACIGTTLRDLGYATSAETS